MKHGELTKTQPSFQDVAVADARLWAERLSDQRGKKVVFLSHCLLNENSRYLGGACRAGAIPEILQTCIDQGYGIVQMPCPEERAWGGVLKRRLVWFFGSQGTLHDRLRIVLLSIGLWYTRRVYRRLARQIAGQIEDYISSGFTVVGIVGVDGSPSCGVGRTLNMKRSLQLVSTLPATAGRDNINSIIQACVVEGKGIFIGLLRRELDRRRLDVPFLAHDMIEELKGRDISLSF